MKTFTTLVVLFLVGCGPLPADAMDASAQPLATPDAGAPDAGPAELPSVVALRATLATFPTCAPGVVTSALDLSEHWCTLKACVDACCNTCSWKVTQGGAPLDAAAVALLGLPDGALDCEVSAWAAVLATEHIGFLRDGAGAYFACVGP